MDNDTILIVDDSFVNRQILTEIFKEKFNIMEASDGEMALKLLTENSSRIAAILLDIVMPKLNGYDVIQEMAKSKELREIPIIVISASGGAETEMKSLNIGATDFIYKPFNPQIVTQRVLNAISRKQLKDVLIEKARLEEKANLIEQHKYEAEHDKITGLYNFQTFCNITNEYLKTIKESHVIIRYEITNFKVINDLFAYKVGDMVLQKLAKISKEYFSDSIQSRVYADHLLVCVPKRNLNYKKMVECFKERINELDIPFNIVLLFGIYEIDDVSIPVELMCDRALLAINKIKSGYQSNYYIYDQNLRSMLIDSQWVANNMLKALENEEFEVFFQPQFDSTTNMIIGAEALARWRHPEKGLISPANFIPIFEQNGFITKLDEYVWDKAAKWLHEYISKYGIEKAIPISVNISRIDILYLDLATILKNIVKKYNLPIDLFRIEITESAYSTEYETVVNQLADLKKAGFVIEMDDFGSAYSSLNCLKNLPIDIIKLDMKFISGDDALGRGGTIVSSIIRMAQWLNLDVIAEGVEKEEHASFLNSVGCFSIQGYLYSYPLPINDFTDLLKQNGIAKKQSTQNYFFKDSEFWNTNALSSIIFNSYVGSAAVFEIDSENHVEILRVNQVLLDMLDIKKNTIDLYKINFLSLLSPSEISIAKQAINKITGTNIQETVTLRFNRIITKRKDICVKLTLKQIASLPKRNLYYTLIEDVTEKTNLENRLLVEDEKYNMILETLNVAALDLDVKNDIGYAVIFHDGKKDSFVINNYLKKFMDRNTIHDDDKGKVYLDLKRSIEDNISGNIDAKLNLNNQGFEKNSIKYRSLTDKDGNVFRVICGISKIND